MLGGTGKEQTVEDEAKETLSFIVHRVLWKACERETDIDLLSESARFIRNVMDDGKGKLENSRRALNHIEKLSKHVKRSEKATGVMELILADQIFQAKGIVIFNERQMEMGRLMLEMLKTYNWDGPVPKPPSRPTGSFYIASLSDLNKLINKGSIE